MTIRTVRLHVASAGNEFMEHIASLFAEGFSKEGLTATVVVDGVPLDEPLPDVLHLVVAPHEYFPLHFLRHRPTIELAPTLAAAALLNVEQPGSDWFEVAWGFLRRARLAFDLSPAGVAELRRRGLDALHTPLGYTASLEADGRLPIAERPIDILFLGNASPRRTAFFARHAEFFSARNCQLVFSDPHRPKRTFADGYRAGRDRLLLVASSRIVLNVHAADRSYFEQHRAMLTLANGALLVSERSRDTAPFEAGEHFVSASLDELPAMCGYHLEHLTTIEALASAGRQQLIGRTSMRQSCRLMLNAAETPETTGNGEVFGRREDVRARLQEGQRRLASGDAPWSVVTNSAFDATRQPAVSVLVTLYNYTSYIERCLQSVVDATPPPGGLEIVVVDDASTDGSADTVEAFTAPLTVPVQLLRKTLNTGLADARNVGLHCARGRAVFILDADNWIYPQCLALLAEALSEGGVAAVYGVIARIEEHAGEGVDLVSALDWSERALVERPYIDAMALFERQAVLAVGGYSTELIDHGWFGWEDYDLWLKLAQAGRACRLVPRIVAAYRDHGASMLRQTNRSSERLAQYFRSKFADLVQRHPGLETYFGFWSDSGPTSPEELEIRQLQLQISRLEQQLVEVYRSRSWQLTAPLRAVLDRKPRRS
jgi:glycosyltransferase involved in cell wall biosynthesis